MGGKRVILAVIFDDASLARIATHQGLPSRPLVQAPARTPFGGAERGHRLMTGHRLRHEDLGHQPQIPRQPIPDVGKAGSLDLDGEAHDKGLPDLGAYNYGK